MCPLCVEPGESNHLLALALTNNYKRFLLRGQGSQGALSSEATQHQSNSLDSIKRLYIIP